MLTDLLGNGCAIHILNIANAFAEAQDSEVNLSVDLDFNLLSHFPSVSENLKLRSKYLSIPLFLASLDEANLS